MSYQTIQFEGCTVAVLAPEDLEEKDAERERLHRELAETRAVIAKLRMEHNALLSAIDYAMGPPNEYKCSLYDVDCNGERVLEDVKKLVVERDHLKERLIQREATINRLVRELLK